MQKGKAAASPPSMMLQGRPPQNPRGPPPSQQREGEYNPRQTQAYQLTGPGQLVMHSMPGHMQGPQAQSRHPTQQFYHSQRPLRIPRAPPPGNQPVYSSPPGGPVVQMLAHTGGPQFISPGQPNQFIPQHVDFPVSMGGQARDPPPQAIQGQFPPVPVPSQPQGHLIYQSPTGFPMGQPPVYIVRAPAPGMSQFQPQRMESRAREKKIIQIKDPNSNKDVTEEILKQKHAGSLASTAAGTPSVTPNLSGQSSNSSTPPLTSQQQAEANVQAQFAGQVAATLKNSEEKPKKNELAVQKSNANSRADADSSKAREPVDAQKQEALNGPKKNDVVTNVTEKASETKLKEATVTAKSQSKEDESSNSGESVQGPKSLVSSVDATNLANEKISSVIVEIFTAQEVPKRESTKISAPVVSDIIKMEEIVKPDESEKPVATDALLVSESKTLNGPTTASHEQAEEETEKVTAVSSEVEVETAPDAAPAVAPEPSKAPEDDDTTQNEETTQGSEESEVLPSSCQVEEASGMEKVNGHDGERKASGASKITVDSQSPVTPPEINLRGPKALEAYNRALTEGKTLARRIPIMLIGQDRSGKTSLKKSLQGLRFNPDEGSTVGIDVDPSYFKVTTEIWKTGKKDQAANKEEMAASFEHHVARVVVENLREQELTSEVKTIDKVKDLESSSTISSETQIVSERNGIPEDLQGLSTAIVHDEVGSSADSFLTTQIETENYGDSSKSSVAAHVGGGSRVFQTTENYPAPTKARDNTVSSGMIPEEIATLIKKLRDKVDKVDSEDDIYSVLWDFAGQSVYYETHQLFLTSKAIYVLVYDLSRDPVESAQAVKKQGVFEKIEEKSCTKTNLEYLDYWMTSVSSQSSRFEDHNLCSVSTSTVLPKTLPPVFLVCTHSDQPFGGKDPSELAINVYGSLKTKSYGEHLFHDVFKVDNTKSGRQKECPEVKRLRESILAVAMELPQLKENIPIKWLKYEEMLQVVLHEGHKWITIEHAKRIASEVCQIHDDQEFVTVLDSLHDQRILIHFDDTVELNNLVVLDPQWLIDVFKTVITVTRYDQQERGLNDLWLKLEREGILEEKLLQHMWGKIVKEHDTFESLIAIMERFSLLCSWPSSNQPCGKEYLVPSMLRQHPPQGITKLITSASLSSLFVKFKCAQVPSNLFPRLVVQFLQWGRNKLWSTDSPQLYKNFARFFTAEDKSCSVVFLCHSSLIEVVVHEGNVCSQEEDRQADLLGNSPGGQRDSFEVFCAREVFRQLVLLLECLRKEFCWLKRMKYEAGITCPVCCHNRLVKYCRTHDKEDCKWEECLHFIPESELRNANQFITCTRSAVAVNNKVYTKGFTVWFANPREETTTDASGGRLLCSRRENEDKSLTLPGNVVESLSSSSDPKEIVLQLKENLHLDQTDLKKPTPETTRMIRCFAATAKDSNRVDVVKHLREITPAGTTGPLLPGKLDICNIPVEKMRELTIDLTVTDWRWKVVAEKLGLRAKEITFLDMRYPNPSEAALTFVAQYRGLNVDYLYDVLTECGMPMLADIL